MILAISTDNASTITSNKLKNSVHARRRHQRDRGAGENKEVVADQELGHDGERYENEHKAKDAYQTWLL